MRTPLQRVAVSVLALFGLLLLNANYVQLVQAGSLEKDPHNGRVLLREYERQRGPIVVAGRDVARSIATNDALKYLRSYPGGPTYAHLTGFYSFVFGATAIERTENSILAGTDDRLFIKRLSDLFTGREQQGGAVVLTIDPAAQAAAASALGNRRGAVVALDPRTGAILAMVSSPSYDPGPLSSHDGKQIRAARARLLDDPANPLLNRAINETYPPGSLFKVVTAAAALSSGRYTPDTRVPSPRRLDLPQTTRTLGNFGGETCGDGRTDTLFDAFVISCNTAFAAVGLNLGGDALREQAQKFGFGERLEVPLSVSRSVFPPDLDQPQTAFSAIGQFDVRITPLQGAMIAAAVANHGTVMRPYLVREVKAPDLSTLDVAHPTALGDSVSPQVADRLTAMMQAVVDQGTATVARIPGVAVAGKTGTAQHGAGAAPHAWFAGFAPADNPQVAVAAIVEDGGELGSEATGGRVAAPIVQAVMQAVLGQ